VVSRGGAANIGFGSYNVGMIFLVLVILLLPALGEAQELTRAQKEELLLEGNMSSERELSPGVMRVTLNDGIRQHAAIVESSRDTYRRNAAAYALDKALGLNMVPPTVIREFKGQPAGVNWWADDVAMNEQDRRKRETQPPDPDGWDKQMQSVRVFDELISNTYRNIGPEFFLTTLWDNLLITRDWKISLIDHKAAFRITRQLENPASLVRCDRGLLGRLRKLNREVLRQELGQYLSAEELDGLEARRELIVKHFDERIAERGEGVVLYDPPPRNF